MKTFSVLALIISLVANFTGIALAGDSPIRQTLPKEEKVAPVKSSATVNSVSALEKNSILVDGSTEPLRVPDTVAYSLLFRFLSGRRTKEEKGNAIAYIKFNKLGDPDQLLSVSRRLR